MNTLANGQFNQLKGVIRGTILQTNDAGYDEARTVWNAMIDRRPAIIVRCAGTADVRACVAYARDHGLPLAVRGGGHNIAGSALCDDGLVIDLSGMKSVQVDPQQRRAWVEGGATLRDFDHEAQAYGLATPLGINSTTGVAGLALGGGFGWLSRTLGLAADNLLSAEMVTADAQRLHVSAADHPRPVLGHPWRRRQLWRGHPLRIPAAPGGSGDYGRADRVPVRPGQGGLGAIP